MCVGTVSIVNCDCESRACLPSAAHVVSKICRKWAVREARVGLLVDTTKPSTLGNDPRVENATNISGGKPRRIIRIDLLRYLFRLLSLRKRRSASTSSSASSSSVAGGGEYRRKMNEVERLAEMERQRRQREVEARMVEEESAARIEALVQQRVQEELERRKVRLAHS